MHKVRFSHQAEKFLRSVHPKHARQPAKAVLRLCDNPLTHDARKLKGSDYLRCDTGEYRIIYIFDKKTIRIVIIGKRNDSDVYRKLQRKK